MSKMLHHVLLVDDDEDDNFIHTKTLRASGLVDQVTAVSDGIEALEFLRKEQKSDRPLPELILLDINMPVMDGWEFLEKFGKTDESLKVSVIIVMLTTSSNPDDKNLAMEKKTVKDFFTKPITKDDVEKIIKRTLLTIQLCLVHRAE